MADKASSRESRRPSEAQLVARARDGEVAAFESLYRSHVGRVFALCLRMVRERGEAQELTQEVFVRAWEKLGTFRGDSAFGSWLHRVAVNTVLGHLRSRKRLSAHLVEAPMLEEEAGTLGPASRQTPALSIDLERAISTLPPQARLVFVLHEIHGYLHDEIGEQLGITAGACKAHLHRARRQLQKVLR